MNRMYRNAPLRRIKDDASGAMVFVSFGYSNFEGAITDDVNEEFGFFSHFIDDENYLMSLDQFMNKICNIAQRNNAEVSEFPKKIGRNGSTLYVVTIDSEDSGEDVTIYYVFVDTSVTSRDIDPLWGNYMKQYGV